MIPCLALTAATLQHSEVQAQSRFERRIQERIQKRRLQEESKLTDTQKQQLFEARRNWAVSSYDQCLALLKSGQSCLENAQTFDAGKTCRQKQQQARRQLLEQARQAMNGERQRLGLSPLRSISPFGF
ncbi:hypothetical protein OAA31_00245 [bacterium]|nr:hypothetical protein [bacterium]